MNHLPYFADLTPYSPGREDNELGITPLAVGWLRRGKPFQTGAPPAGFLFKLAGFCLPENSLEAFARPLPCGLETHPVKPLLARGRPLPLGRREIRVIGLEEIYAAPDLIYHYVAEHGYLPPREFIDAVDRGPQPGSPELKALLRALGG